MAFVGALRLHTIPDVVLDRIPELHMTTCSQDHESFATRDTLEISTISIWNIKKNFYTHLIGASTQSPVSCSIVSRSCT